MLLKFLSGSRIPVLFLFVKPFKFENDGPRTIIATGDHHLFVVCPSFHDIAALQGCVDVATNTVPGLRAEFPIHHAKKVFSINKKFLAVVEFIAWSKRS